MTVEDVVAVSWITVIKLAKISRLSPQIRHEVDAERLCAAAGCSANASSGADAAAICV